MHDREAQAGLTEDETPRARAEKRAALAAERKAKRTLKRGLVIVNTGDGKGKTTAALGVLFRAWGREMRVVMFQFIKASSGKWGEVQAAKRIGVEIVPLGDGFTWESDNIAKDRALAAAGLDASAIDAVVTVSSTGVTTPSLDARVLPKLGFRPAVERTPVFGLGCAGGVNGLANASRLATARRGTARRSMRAGPRCWLTG